MLIIDEEGSGLVTRQEAFEEFARRRSAGDVFVPPGLLTGDDRSLHIRQTLREDHEFRIRNRPEGAAEKFAKLASSPFKFFRGTALLYYRDQAGTDGELPVVFTVGDIHPENFGVMPNEDGTPFFGLDDFDEAYFAPFSWDVKRGAVGFNLCARENGLKKKKRKKVVRSFVKGYIDGLMEFARDDREKWHQFRIDNSPSMIQDLLESALESRKEFLAELIDLDKGEFQPAEEVVPHSRSLDQFQKAIEDYVEENDIPLDTRAGHFKVKDVAVKKGSGTASLGLDRYYVLIEGPGDDHADDVILEMKQTRQSALHGLVPQKDAKKDEEGTAERIVNSHAIHLVGGDPYYGVGTLDDRDFLIREESPYESDIDVDDLSKSELREYAHICGRTLSHAHARSDEDTDLMEGQAEKKILESIKPKLFKADIVRFAETISDRICSDYELFCEDFERGAFEFSHGG